MELNAGQIQQVRVEYSRKLFLGKVLLLPQSSDLFAKQGKLWIFHKATSTSAHVFLIHGLWGAFRLFGYCFPRAGLARVFGESMTETQRRVLRAIETGHALEAGDGILVESRTVHGIHGDPDDIAVSFEWSDEKGYVWEVDFTEQSLNEAKIDGNQIQMMDSEGGEIVVTVFQLEPVHV